MATKYYEYGGANASLLYTKHGSTWDNTTYAIRLCFEAEESNNASICKVVNCINHSQYGKAFSNDGQTFTVQYKRRAQGSSTYTAYDSVSSTPISLDDDIVFKFINDNDSSDVRYVAQTRPNNDATEINFDFTSLRAFLIPEEQSGSGPTSQENGFYIKFNNNSNPITFGNTLPDNNFQTGWQYTGNMKYGSTVSFSATIYTNLPGNFDFATQCKYSVFSNDITSFDELSSNMDAHQGGEYDHNVTIIIPNLTADTNIAGKSLIFKVEYYTQGGWVSLGQQALTFQTNEPRFIVNVDKPTYNNTYPNNNGGNLRFKDNPTIKVYYENGFAHEQTYSDANGNYFLWQPTDLKYNYSSKNFVIYEASTGNAELKRITISVGLAYNTYTISYDSNCEFDSISGDSNYYHAVTVGKKYDVCVDVAAPTITAKPKNSNYNVIEATKILNTNIYFSSSPKTYKITLDKQGSTGGSSYIYEIYKTGYYLDANGQQPFTAAHDSGNIDKPTRIGYIFGGYWTMPNKEGIQIIGMLGNLGSSEQGATPPSNDYFTQDQTIYAYWGAKTVNVHYWNNDGTTNKTSEIYTYGAGEQRLKAAISRNGYRFKFWGTSTTAISGYSAQQLVEPNWIDQNCTAVGNDVNLYAIWEEQSTTPTNLTVNYIDKGTTYEDANLVAGDKFGKTWQSNGSKAGQFQGLSWDKYYIVGWSTSGEHISDQYSNLSAYINFDVYHQVTASDIATYGNSTLILYPVLLTKTRLIWCIGGNINLYSQLFNNDDNTQIKLRIPQHMTGWFTVTHRYISENNGSTIIDYSTQNLQYRANDSVHLKLTMYTSLSQVVDKVYERYEGYQVIANTSDGTLNLNAGKEVSIQTYSDNIHDTFWFYDYENNDYYKTHYNNKYIMIYKVDDNNLVLKYKTKVHVTWNGFAAVPLFSYAQNVYPSSTVITKLYKENSQDNLITSVSGIDSISPSYTYYAEVSLTFNNISEGVVAHEIFCNGYNLVYNNNGTVKTQNFTYYGNPGWSLAPEFNGRDVTTYYSTYQLCDNNYYLIAKIKGFEPLKLISNRHESSWTENLVAYGFSVKDLLEYPIQLKGYVADTDSLYATVRVSDIDSGNVRTNYTLSSIGTNQYGLYIYDREMTGTATLGACGVGHIGPVVTQMDIPRYIGTNNTSNWYAEPLHLAMAVVPHTFLFYSTNFDSDWELIKETFYMDSDSIYFNNDTSLKSHSFTDLEGVYISFKFKNYGQQAHFIDSLIWEGLSNSSYATAYFMCVDANKWDIAQRKELFQSNPNIVTINGKDFAKEYSSEMKWFGNNGANDTRLTKIDSSYKVLLRSKQNTNTIATMTNSNLHVINDGNTYGDAIRPGYDFEVHDEEMIKEGIFKVISEI